MRIVSRTTIRKNLQELDKLYKLAKNPENSQFYSKLALLELCGWIEETMDRIIRSCSKRTIKNPGDLKYIEDFIKDTHSFDYAKSFRRMLIQVIGLCGIAKMEGCLDPQLHQIFNSTLGSLRSRRDTEAHTYLSGVTRMLDAPSVTLQNLDRVYFGLGDINKVLGHQRD